VSTVVCDPSLFTFVLSLSFRLSLAEAEVILTANELL